LNGYITTLHKVNKILDLSLQWQFTIWHLMAVQISVERARRYSQSKSPKISIFIVNTTA
jgi:hypothetical protein